MAHVTPIPTDGERLLRFLESQLLSELQKPIEFPKSRAVNSYNCCLGSLYCLATSGLSLFCQPVGACCPCTYLKHYHLNVDKDSVQFSSATNDCCCHLAISQKTVPLEKIQDVELTTNCLQTCCGVKQVNIQTAGQGSVSAEVAATFLENPERTRDALQLAVKLYRQAATAAPPQAMMQRGAPGSLSQRLRNLEQLVKRGVLSADEAAGLRVGMLAATEDPTVHLTQSADLVDRRLLSATEFGQLKAKLVTKIAQQ